MLLSPSGTGTTHLATAFGLIAPHKGWKVRFTSAADLAIALEGRVKEIMHRVIDMPKLLIIDDIGSLPFGREQATCSSRWWRGATEKGSMILTSNLTFGSWDEAFAGDACSPPPWSTACLAPCEGRADQRRELSAQGQALRRHHGAAARVDQPAAVKPV